MFWYTQLCSECSHRAPFHFKYTTYFYIAFSLARFARVYFAFFVFIFAVRCVCVHAAVSHSHMKISVFSLLLYCEPSYMHASNPFIVWLCVWLCMCVGYVPVECCVLVWVLKQRFYSLFFRSFNNDVCACFWCIRCSLCVCMAIAVRVAKQREQVVCFGVVQRFSIQLNQAIASARTCFFFFN